MIGDYDDDTHFCLKCHATILGLDNYVEHRKAGCNKNLDEPLKSPLPSQILQQDEAFSSLKADDFFSSLELQSSSKKAPPPSTTGKTFSGILTRSKTTAVLQASTSKEEYHHSKSGKNAWIGGHQFKDLGSGDNHSKLIKAVDNLSRNTLKREEPPPTIRVYEESDEDSEEFDFDDETEDEDNQEIPPRSYTGGKWKPSSPINWTRSTADNSGWRSPPPSHTKGKWKPVSPISSAKEEYSTPPSTFTGSKWSQSKAMSCSSFSSLPPPTHTKGKWKPLDYTQECDDIDDTEYPPPEHTKGKWKPGNMPGSETNKAVCSSVVTKNTTPQIPAKKKSMSLPLKRTCPSPTHTKGKWKPQSPVEDKAEKRAPAKSIKRQSIKKSASPVHYWCEPCNRRLASKVVYERHLKSELHLKRSLHNTEFEDKITTMPRFQTEFVAMGLTPDKKSVTDTKKRNREKLFIRCEVCRSRVNRRMLGKHLISHYHCRKGDITLPEAQKMVLENIHGIILQSPFQCAACKFYCNTQDEFLLHWKSDFHAEKTSVGNGFFLCTFCNYQADDNKQMLAHLTSSEHEEVIAVINRSVPIQIKRIMIIECETCKEKFTLNIQLRKHCEEVGHVFTGLKVDRHSCKPCDRYFRSSDSLAKHQRLQHSKNVYICGLCSMRFDNPEDIGKHRKTAAHRYAWLEKKKQQLGVKDPPKKCDYCPETLSGFLEMKKHLKEKHPERAVSCPTCGKTFTVPQDLTVHVRTKACAFNEESPKLEFSCTKCPFGTNSKSEQLFHEALHTEPLISYSSEEQSSKKKPIAQYKCPVCEKLYSKASLRCHLRVHTSERPYVCSICGMGFVRKNNWMVHTNNHTNKEIKKKQKDEIKVAQGERPFLCSTCGATFKRRFVLQQHMLTHTGKQCRCPKVGCIYVARTPSALRDHFRTHCDLKSFACNICSYKGKSKNQLIRHQTIHETSRKYECTLCPFTARFSGHLKRHMRTHTGAKPFACPHCSYRSNNLENLRKHVISTNKHPGKYLYECKFCENDDERFKVNFAKEFKGHLINKHKDRFQTGSAAASYITGIYEAQNDSVMAAKKIGAVDEKSDDEQEDSSERNKQPQASSSSSSVQRLHDPVIAYTTSEAAGLSTMLLTSASKQDSRNQEELFPMLVIAKDEVVEMSSSTDAWSMVGSYDVEGGVLIPFQTDEESLFEEHFS